MPVASSLRYTMDDLLKLTVEKGASDLHLAVGLPPILRISGKLTPTELPRLVADDTKRLIYSILNERQKEKFEKTWELDCSHGVRDYGRFRVNVFKQRGNVGATLRAISSVIPTREELNLPQCIEDMVRKPQGLILVTGATGQGKSTTLACMLDLINSEQNFHILTIEDPIEYVHFHKKSMINQRELGQDTMSWANALRSSLREDPDVILVGEMRDLDTMSGTLTAAETGHLVFGTLHTNSAAKAIDRLIDAFPIDQQAQVRTMISESLRGVVAQQLIPRKDGQGRALACELLINNTGIANLIRDGKTYQITVAMQTGKKDGMCVMDNSILELYQQGIISHEEAESRSNNRDLYRHAPEVKQEGKA